MDNASDTTNTNITTSAIEEKFASNTTVRSIYIGLDVFNTFLHSLCLYLLIVVYKRSARKTAQKLFIINLSSAEAIGSVFLVVRDVCNLLRLFDDGPKVNSSGVVGRPWSFYFP